MQIMDSAARYGAITRFFHWSIATLILWQLLSVALKNAFGWDNALSSFIVLSHKPVGLAAFVLIALRVVWALINLGRRPGHGHGLMGLAAKSGHLAIYALMIAVPGAALLRAYNAPRGLSVFGVEVFAPRAAGQANPLLVSLGDNWHGVLAWGLALMVLGHIAMAVFHTTVMKDRTMRRMAGRTI